MRTLWSIPAFCGPRKSTRLWATVDPGLLRPAEVHTLVGDSSKAREKLGWTCGLSFEDLIREMVQADLEHYGRGAPDPEHG